MTITAIRTPRISAGQTTLIQLLGSVLESLPETSVLAITSKIVALCENRTIPVTASNKADLIRRYSDKYLPASTSDYGIQFTITNDTLIPTAGIDESNGDGNYILWPEDPQAAANEVREWISTRFDVKDFGVIITDSTCHPLRRGTIGISLAHSGFAALRNYVGTPDLFGREMKASHADISGGLAAAAVLAMGEGAEQTPLCLVTDLDSVDFQRRNPTKEELANIRITPEEDLFGPFLNNIKWEQGERNIGV
jgi:dihydrofolate synthase / folylpolyglutamate synthase